MRHDAYTLLSLTTTIACRYAQRSRRAFGARAGYRGGGGEGWVAREGKGKGRSVVGRGGDKGGGSSRARVVGGVSLN